MQSFKRVRQSHSIASYRRATDALWRAGNRFGGAASVEAASINYRRTPALRGGGANSSCGARELNRAVAAGSLRANSANHARAHFADSRNQNDPAAQATVMPQEQLPARALFLARSHFGRLSAARPGACRRQAANSAIAGCARHGCAPADEAAAIPQGRRQRPPTSSRSPAVAGATRLRRCPPPTRP